MHPGGVGSSMSETSEPRTLISDDTICANGGKFTCRRDRESKLCQCIATSFAHELQVQSSKSGPHQLSPLDHKSLIAIGVVDRRGE